MCHIGDSHIVTSICLAPETEQLLDFLASSTGRIKAYYLRELIDHGLPSWRIKVDLQGMNVQRTRALASWRRLLEHPVARMNAEEQYHELLKAADQMELAGLINGDEWRKLVRKAGASFISTDTAAAEATQ